MEFIGMRKQIKAKKLYCTNLKPAERVLYRPFASLQIIFKDAVSQRLYTI